MADQTHGYGTVARVFHWVMVPMVLVQIPVGIAMTSEGFPSIGDALFILHKGTGCILLVLVAARILWRLTHPVSTLLPHLPVLERRIAALTHGVIYVLLVVMPVSGYIRTAGDNFPIELLDMMHIPPLVSDIPETARVMLVIHKFSAYTLTALIAAHVGAVMHHALIVRDATMLRIWPPVGRKGPQARG